MEKGYSKKELQQFEKKLRKLREKIVDNVEALEEEVHHKDGNSNLSYNHLADVDSDAFEEEITLGQMENEEEMVQRIDEALGRIADGSYGLCMKTGKKILKARLEAIPYAEYTVEAQEELEREGDF